MGSLTANISIKVNTEQMKILYDKEHLIPSLTFLEHSLKYNPHTIDKLER